MIILILVPRLNNTGPARGAEALYWALREELNVKILETKMQPRARLIEELRNSDVVISMCFSSDLIAYRYRCKFSYKWIASIRSNLDTDYKYLYGVKGFFLAKIHFIILKKADIVVGMTSEMLKPLSSIKHKSVVIENLLEPFQIVGTRTNISIMFCGSLTYRKGIMDLLEVYQSSDFNIPLHIFGDGPLMERCQTFVSKHMLDASVKFHGFVPDARQNITPETIFVLPSYSEGISRACLEAMYAGAYIIVRDIGESVNFVQQRNGRKFNTKAQLLTALSEVKELIEHKKFSSGLPERFQPKFIAQKWKTVINEVFNA